MRPSILDPLFAPITSLEGVGPKVAGMIERIVPADLGDRIDAGVHGDAPALLANAEPDAVAFASAVRRFRRCTATS